MGTSLIFLFFTWIFDSIVGKSMYPPTSEVHLSSMQGVKLAYDNTIQIFFLYLKISYVVCMPCRLKKNLKTQTKYLYLELFIFFLINKFPNSVNFCAFNYKNSPQFCFITCIYPNFTNKYLLDICVLFFSLKLKFVFCDLYC